MGEAQEVKIKLLEDCILIRRDYFETISDFFPEPRVWPERMALIDLLFLATKYEKGCQVNRNYLTARYGWKQEHLYRFLRKLEDDGIIHWEKVRVHAPRGCGVEICIYYTGGDHGDR